MAACALLLVVYGALSFLNDPRGYLGTDTGGKVATLEVMSDRGRLDPDIGYWAERWDPAGRVHPLYFTSHIGDRWVNVTTVPMLYAAYPLYRLGGYRFALLLPMLGAVLAALAARALARRISGGDGWAVFWLVGLASPLAVYALDFWEHSIGVAAMAWAVVALLDIAEHRRWWPWALVAGALFGVAATLRTEALVYGSVAVGLACVILLVRHRRPWTAVVTGVAAGVGLAVPLLANVALENATVGHAIRAGRAADTASAAVSTSGDVTGSRLEEAVLNAAALHPAMDATAYLVGAVLSVLLAFVVLRASRAGDSGPAVLACAGVAALYAIRFADGPGFVPGLVAATPVAIAGLALGWTSAAARYLLGVGLLALPVVWATQFQGGAAPQWGGRYLLTSGLLFGAVGLVAVHRMRPWAGRGMVGLAALITLFGLAWMSIRTHDVARASSELDRRREPVLLSRVGHLVREAGAFYGDRRWLTAVGDADQQFAVDVIERAGVTRFAVVQFADRPAAAIDGWRVVGVDRLRFLPEVELSVTAYEYELTDS